MYWGHGRGHWRGEAAWDGSFCGRCFMFVLMNSFWIFKKGNNLKNSVFIILRSCNENSFIVQFFHCSLAIAPDSEAETPFSSGRSCDSLDAETVLAFNVSLCQWIIQYLHSINCCLLRAHKRFLLLTPLNSSMNLKCCWVKHRRKYWSKHL